MERTIKKDGRYLIYYSWPDEPPPGAKGVQAPESTEAPEDRAGTGARRQLPRQEPWSPETDPADV
jgi:hypothetical protein